MFEMPVLITQSD